MCRGTTYLRRRKAASHPSNVRHTAPLLTAGRRAPALFGLLLRSVIPPTRAARLSPARALLEPVFRGTSLPHGIWIALIVAGFPPLVKSFAPGHVSHTENARKLDKTAAPRTTVRPFFLSTRLSPPPIVLQPRTRFSLPRAFPAPPLDSAPRRPSKPPPVEPTTRRTADAVFLIATKHPALSRRVFCGSPFTK